MKMSHIHEMIVPDEHANAGGFQLRFRVFHSPVALSAVVPRFEFFEAPMIRKGIKLF